MQQHLPALLKVLAASNGTDRQTGGRHMATYRCLTAQTLSAAPHRPAERRLVLALCHQLAYPEGSPRSLC